MMSTGIHFPLDERQPLARHHDSPLGRCRARRIGRRSRTTLGVPPSIQTLLFTPSTYQIEITATGVDGWHRIEPMFDDYFKAAALAVSLEQQ